MSANNSGDAQKTGRHFYLRRGEKSFGPFTEIQLEALRLTPDFGTYSWLWDSSTSQWAPLAPPPPAPSVEVPATSGPAFPQSAAEPAAPQAQSPAALHPLDHFQVTCMDRRSLISGVFYKVSDRGCELLTEDARGHFPFSDQAQITINLFDSRSGQTQNVVGVLARVRRQGTHWSFLIRWKRCPEILQLAA